MSIRVHPWRAKRNAFRHELTSWNSSHGRDLPWRRTRDPYAILVSEFMLQQTQVVTVIPYYTTWLERFPDFISLAKASESEVLHAWQGLGYYARARNLRATAKAIVALHGGTFPQNAESTRKLPGLGRYTANAVATFAFDQSVPVVEANIARLLARLLNLQLPIDSAAGKETLWETAAALVPQSAAGKFNSALMDLGAMICTSRQPKCGICPVRNFCRAVNPETLPLKKPRTAVKLLTEDHAFAFENEHILLEQSKKRWRGMWILPRLAADAREAELPLYKAEFPFTHHRITLTVYRSSPNEQSFHRWFPLATVDSLPLPSPHRRAVTHLLAGERQRLCSTLAAT